MRCHGIVVLVITFGGSFALPEDLPINQYVNQDQKDVELAFNENGQGAVVWNSYLQDGSSGGIFARRLLQTGLPNGDEFQVNTRIEANQAEPDVAMDPNGNFLVCWRSPNALADNDDVFARLFDPNGGALTDDIMINTFVENDQRNPRVAAVTAGYVIVWESLGRLGDDNRQVCARQIDGQGRPLGSEILVSDAETDCRNADVATNAEGRFVVVWLEGKSSYHIKARLFDSTGAPEGASFRIDTIPPRSVTSPSAALDDLGGYVIVWDGDPNRAADDDVHMRRYDPNGLALGDQVVVNTTQQGTQRNPRVALNPHGVGLVVWEHESGSDANGIDIVGQYLDPNGVPMGPELQYNAYEADNQQDPALCILPSGQALVAWESDAQDGSGRGVFASLSPPCITADWLPGDMVGFLDFCVLRQDLADSPGDILGPLEMASLCEQWIIETEPGEDGP